MRSNDRPKTNRGVTSVQSSVRGVSGVIVERDGMERQESEGEMGRQCDADMIIFFMGVAAPTRDVEHYRRDWI